MIFFQESNSTKTGKVSEFLPELKKHKYYKIGSKLLLKVKDRECAFSKYGYEGSTPEELRMQLEEHELTDDDIKMMVELGKKGKVLLKSETVKIELIFNFKTKEEFLEFSITSYSYTGYDKKTIDPHYYGGTGFIVQNTQSKNKLRIKSVDNIFFSSKTKFFPASLTSLDMLYNIADKTKRKYTKPLINGLLDYLKVETGSYIFLDVKRDLKKLNKNHNISPVCCPVKLSELKNFNTKKELFISKYMKKIASEIIPKDILNKFPFYKDYLLVTFIKKFGTGLILELLKDNGSIFEYKLYEFISRKTANEVLRKIIERKYRKNYPEECYFLGEDIERMLEILPAKKIRKIQPGPEMLKDIEKAIDFHDRIINLIDDKELKKIGITRPKTKDKIQEDKQRYAELLQYLPEQWHMFQNRQELIHESHIMNNCIKIYGTKCEYGESGLFFAEIDHIRYNAEVKYNSRTKKMKLVQLFGPHNTEPALFVKNMFLDSIERFSKLKQ